MRFCGIYLLRSVGRGRERETERETETETETEHPTTLKTMANFPTNTLPLKFTPKAPRCLKL